MKLSKIRQTRYLLPDNMTKKSFLDTLGQEFVVKQVENTFEKFAILDSFEWALYEHGIMAIRQDNKLISLWFDEEEILDPDVAHVIEGINAKTRFWWQLPDSPEQKVLKKLLDLRALYPIFEGMLRTEQFNLMDNDGKILVFCQLISITRPENSRTPIFRMVRIQPVTGYTAENKQAAQLIKSLGGFMPRLSPMDSLLAALGISPQPFSIKPELALDPQMSSRAAASAIISIMIAKQRQTENGIIKDIDTEFLHHYRVALRMVRAAVAQLKEVFPPQDVISLKQRFGALASETNHLRDLDVFILDKERYMGLLPPSLRDGLLPMFNDFEQSRSVEVKRIARWLNNRAYKQEIAELESLFENGYSALETHWSEQPIIELAVTKIQKRYKKIQKAAAKITHDTPDDDIHDIRIDCKKLRYLLYFFGSLFNKKQVKIAGKHLKALQDHLGIFNDLSVQAEFLENYLDKIEHKSRKDILLIASLGGLISSLHTMQLLERERCIDALAEFSNKENQKLFNNTFKNQSPKLRNNDSKSSNAKQKGGKK